MNRRSTCTTSLRPRFSTRVASFVSALICVAAMARPATAFADDSVGAAAGAGIGGLVAVFDIVAVGYGIEQSVRTGTGLPIPQAAAELAGAGMHAFAGSFLTWLGLETGDDLYLAFSIPALVFSAYYLVHGIYGLAVPGRDPNREADARLSVLPVPRPGGAAVELSLTF